MLKEFLVKLEQLYDTSDTQDIKWPVKYLKLALKFYSLVKSYNIKINSPNGTLDENLLYEAIMKLCESNVGQVDKKKLPYYCQANLLKYYQHIDNNLSDDELLENIVGLRSLVNEIENNLSSSVQMLSYISTVKLLLTSIPQEKINKIKDNILYLVNSGNYNKFCDALGICEVDLKKQYLLLEKRTLLHIASENGHGKIVAKLIEEGADVKAKDNKRSTPLHCASEKGYIKIVKLLLEAGVDVNNDLTVLHYAALYGHKEIVELLISKVNVNARDNNGWTALHHAAFHGHKEIVEILIEKNADVNAKTTNNAWSWTALHYAAFHGHIEVVENLIDKGADISAVDSDGKTPLALAQKYGKTKIAETLIKKAAELGAEENDRTTELSNDDVLSDNNISPGTLEDSCITDIVDNTPIIGHDNAHHDFE